MLVRHHSCSEAEEVPQGHRVHNFSILLGHADCILCIVDLSYLHSPRNLYARKGQSLQPIPRSRFMELDVKGKVNQIQHKAQS